MPQDHRKPDVAAPESIRLRLAALGTEMESAGGLIVGAADPRHLDPAQVLWQAGSALRYAIEAVALAQVVTRGSRSATQHLFGRTVDELGTLLFDTYDRATAVVAEHNVEAS